MAGDDTRSLALWAIRRSLGISLGLYVFYLIAPAVWAVPPLTTRDVLAIMLVVFIGVMLGIGFSTFWPLPSKKGLPRVIRTALLTIPALGFGMAIHVALEGAEGSRAFWVIFALAAWLGSTYIKEEDVETERGTDASPAEA